MRRTRALLRALEDPADAHSDGRGARVCAPRLGGSCQSPIAAYAELDAESNHAARLGGGAGWLAAAARLPVGQHGNPAALGRQLAERILAAGAGPCSSACGAS